MKKETLMKLEEKRTQLSDVMSEMEAIIFQIDDEDSISDMIKAVEGIQSSLITAQRIIKEIKEL